MADTKPHILLAVNVRRITEGLGMPVSEVADELGISRARLFEIFSGQYDPELELIVEMARILEVPVSELFTELRDMPQGTIVH